MGFKKLWDPDKVVLIYDHLVPASQVDDTRHFHVGNAFAEKYGMKHVQMCIRDRADAISELTEDLGRQVSPDELSLYLDMSLEEIEDLLRIAGETIEVADSQKA